MNRLVNVAALVLAIIVAALFVRELFVDVPSVHVARMRFKRTQWNVPTWATIAGLAGALAAMAASTALLLRDEPPNFLWRSLQAGGLIVSATAFLVWVRDFFSSAGSFR